MLTPGWPESLGQGQLGMWAVCVGPVITPCKLRGQQGGRQLMDGHSPPTAQIQSWVHFTGRTPQTPELPVPRETRVRPDACSQVVSPQVKTSDCKHVGLGLVETRFSFSFRSLFFPFSFPLFPFFYIYIYIIFFHTVQPPSGLTAHRYTGWAKVAGCS